MRGEQRQAGLLKARKKNNTSAAVGVLGLFETVKVCSFSLLASKLGWIASSTLHMLSQSFYRRVLMIHRKLNIFCFSYRLQSNTLSSYPIFLFYTSTACLVRNQYSPAYAPCGVLWQRLVKPHQRAKGAWPHRCCERPASRNKIYSAAALLRLRFLMRLIWWRVKRGGRMGEPAHKHRLHTGKQPHLEMTALRRKCRQHAREEN